MIIETERLILRDLTEDDLEALMKVFTDKENMKYYPYEFDREKVLYWITYNIERYKSLGFGLLAVVLKETGEVIGDCGLTMQVIHRHIKPEIGYHIRSDMQRKGYAKEGAIAVRDWTFKNTPFKEIYSYMEANNEPSYLCAMSWGCKFVEQFKDSQDGMDTKVYKITKEDWEKIK